MRNLLFLISLVPTIGIATECRFSAQRDFDVDAVGLTTLAIALESHDAEVEGVAGLSKVEVRGRACASNEAWLDALTVDQQRSGDALMLTTHQRQSSDWHLFGSSYAYLELHVRVPPHLALGIRGSSGDARVRNVAALDFDTSSGDLKADAIAGALTLEVSSGNVHATGIGSAHVRGISSGDIGLRDVRGDVKVVRSGSGDLQFDNVAGSVEIGSVGSGDVSIGHVDRDVSVESVGSGDVSVSDIGGNFEVRSVGSGDVQHRGVRGTVTVPRDDD
jgi:hypothetical protein